MLSWAVWGEASARAWIDVHVRVGRGDGRAREREAAWCAHELLARRLARKFSTRAVLSALLKTSLKPMGKRGGMTVANLKVERWVSCPFHDEIPALVRHDGDGACNLTLGLEGQIFRERE